ncbi:MAG: CCA-adding enzyme [Syntrophaceae bacterium PtaB.Bin038]|nr:MAG: CCA-adding enzyme [Syntrophaceae bacterium PtaB.Bin038]
MLSRYRPFLEMLLDLEPDLHVAGGAVKDRLLGTPVADVDIVYAPDAAGIAARFARRAGAARVAFREDEPDRSTERVIARAGEDTLVFDFTRRRGPSIEEDLAGRDFTVTAMALPLDAFLAGDFSRLVDPLGGRSDLRDRRIRAVSDGSFRRDPLRLLRAFRLAAESGFAIDAGTQERIVRDRALLSGVSGERVRDEVFRVLEVTPCHPFVEAMDRAGLLSEVLPGTGAMKGIEQNGYHSLDVWSHTLLCLERLEGLIRNPAEEFGDAAADFPGYLAGGFVRGRSRAALLKLATILHDAGKPEKASRGAGGETHFYGHAAAGGPVVDAAAERLRLATAERDYLKLLVSSHMHLVHLTAQPARTKRAVLGFFRRYGEDYRALLLLFAADTRATLGPKMTPTRLRQIREAVAEMLHVFETELQPRLREPPLLTGRDLMERFGLREGPLVGDILREVEDARLEGRLRDRDAALEFAAVLLKDKG